jgi:hypothetical protein
MRRVLAEQPVPLQAPATLAERLLGQTRALGARCRLEPLGAASTTWHICQPHPPHVGENQSIGSFLRSAAISFVLLCHPLRFACILKTPLAAYSSSLPGSM